MSINIGVIEKDFEYIDPEVFRNQIPSSKMRPGFHLDNYIFAKYTKIVDQKKTQGHDIKEGDLFREIVTRFALGHFNNKQTVNRDIYDNTVEENEKLTSTVTQLSEIINSHDLTPKGQVSGNRSSSSWPPNTTYTNDQFPKPNANGFATPNANGFATPNANGFATQSANGFATPSANGFATPYANNMANMADISQREAAFSLLFPQFAEYIQMLDMDININKLAIWLRYRIGLQ